MNTYEFSTLLPFFMNNRAFEVLELHSVRFASLNTLTRSLYDNMIH